MTQRHLVAAGLGILLLAPLPAWSQAASADPLEQARAGRIEAALAAIDAVLAQDPLHAEANLMRGVVLAEAGRGGEAERIFAELIDRHPEMPEAYNNLAVLQAGRGDFDAAVTTLKKALATSASYQTAYENLTRIFAQLASEAYSRALEVDSPPTRAEVELVLLSHLSASPSPSPTPSPPPVTVAAPTPRQAPPASGTMAGAEEDEPAPAIASEDLGFEEPVSAAVEAEDEAAEPLASAAEDLAGFVEAWAAAWSEQRVDEYLSFYAPEFLPANGMSREEWAGLRRERVGAPSFIRVDIAILDTEVEAEDRARVTFLQAYESDTFSDQVTKTLTLVKRGSGWKILAETVGS